MINNAGLISKGTIKPKPKNVSDFKGEAISQDWGVSFRNN